MEGERDLSDRHRHSFNGETAGLQVRVLIQMHRKQAYMLYLHESFLDIFSFTSLLILVMFLSQGLYETGRS